MGVESKRIPPLPAPTETESNLPSVLQSDLGTDVTSSQTGDEQSSYSLPDDGTPVTIKTRSHKHTKSQTSLLIEYFETGKSGPNTDRKPSVRVRLTPSSKSRENDHHIKITKTRNSRKTSGSKRIALSQAENLENTDLDDISSYASATEESNVSRAIEVEIDRSGRRRRRPPSPLIPASAVESSRASYMQSEISAIPTDSFLDGSSGRLDGKGSLASPYNTDSLPGGGFPFERMPRDKVSSGRDRERPTVQKTRDKERKHKSSGSKSRTSSVSERHTDGVRSPRRSSRSHQESVVSAADSSILSSQMSASQHSKISATSKTSGSSINNPKLLETVEDAIRRLILPELNALKREQSKRGPRPESLSASSVTNTSRDSRDDRSERRRSAKSADSRDSGRFHESRNREARNDLDEAAPRDLEDDSIELRVDDYGTPRRSHDTLKGATLGAAIGSGVGALAEGSLDQSPSDVAKRRRRRSEKLSSKSNEPVYDEYEHGLQPPMPPMPLSSEISPSEITRTSILSANTDRPHSAMEELTPVREVPRSVPSIASTPTPSRTPKATLEHLGAAHVNVSHGDLKQLPSRRTGEFPKGIEGPVQPEEEEYDEEEDSYQAEYPGYYSQDVPEPLNYVPYQAASRGLSPIESVSGYTDGHSEIQPQRDSRLTQTTGSYSPEKLEEGISNISAPSNIRSRGFEESETGSLRSSGVDAYRNAPYNDNSETDQVEACHEVQIVGANPNFVNSPVAIESNVASLVEGSVIEPSVLSAAYNQQQYSDRDSMVSLEDHAPPSAADARALSPSSRGLSPGSPSVASRRQLFEERMESPVSRKSNLSREFQEYGLDQHGRKVPIATSSRQQAESPTPSEEAITGPAVGAAAAALIAAREFSGTDIVRNKSFKERAQTRQPAVTPKHSVDRFSFDGSPEMLATALPDFAMPEFGYGLDDHSVVDEPLDHHSFDEDDVEEQRYTNVTPTPRDADRGMGFEDVPAPMTAAITGTAAGAIFASHSRQPSQDPSEDFRRNSQDRKRETIITNPYENASPVPMPVGVNEAMLADAMTDQYNPHSFPAGTPVIQQKVDEGYISQGPNRTPDMHGEAKAVGFMDQNQYGHLGDESFGGQKGHARHLSGMSQGMASPLYDAATGTGIDRIENKDIMALMQHLMVRDAQRSARDTEILVTLVRSAADMRNSFEAVTKLLGDVENTVITEVQDNTEKTVRTHLGGPRPYPGSAAPKSIQNGSQAGTDEVAAKKRSFLKKALKGLTVKGNNDLGRIEDMLMQLLSEVDVLKSQTAAPAGARSTVHQPSYDNLQPDVQYEQDGGYEPEGIAGTSTASHASQSSHLPLTQRDSSGKLGYERRFSTENRISTVHEHEDEYEDQEPTTPRQEHYSNTERLMTPTRDVRGSSAPLATSPQPAPAVATGSMSQENTPKEKGKKRGSWLPKVSLSRWSETTASSIGNKFRISGSSKKNHNDDFAQQPPSRSGSDLGAYDANGFLQLRTDPTGDDRVQLQTGYSDDDLDAPSMALPHPSSYMTPEDPKYHAHRNSLNLQHPQPRPGNTEKYKLALETSAQDFEPATLSANWAGSVSSLHRLAEEPAHYADEAHEATANQQFWGPLSPSAGGPPRPPKEPIEYDDANSRSKCSRVSKLQQQQGSMPHHSAESDYGTSMTDTGYGSPKLENRHLVAATGIPTRRPSGPRAMTPKNAAGEESADEGRRKRDTFGTMTSQESETF